jgi:hypothetical protein
MGAPQRTRKDREAIEFVFGALRSGALPANTVAAMAREAGISLITLRRAKEELGVRSVKMGLRAGWVWMLLET